MEIIDVPNDLTPGAGDGTTYTSSGVLDINDDGIGYVGVTGFFQGANDQPPNSQYANTHTVIFKMTDDYGASWTGNQDGSEYYFVPDEVYDHIFASGEYPYFYHNDCDGDDHTNDIVFDDLFCSYELDVRVDSQGNPHFIAGVLGSVGDSVYPGMPWNAFYHFWIDRDYLDNPGEPQTSTGWNYSRIMYTGDMWGWDNADGGSYWQSVFPSLAISTEDESILYVVVSGPDQGEFIVTDDGGTPDDECDDLGLYPIWNEEVFVIKSLDGGATWWNPYNVTQTPADCWVSEAGEFECNPETICNDGETVDEPSEICAHAGTGATDDTVNLLFQRPDWCGGSTTGDLAGTEHKNRLYVGWVELTENPPGDDPVCLVPGDVNGDGATDILDIVAYVNTILYSTPFANPICADMNGDLNWDILDIIAIVNIILYGNRAQDATFSEFQQTENGVSFVSDGFVGAVQMTLTSEGELALQLSDAAMAGAYHSTEGRTTLIVVAPEQGTLFTADSEFQIEEIKAAAGDSYIRVNLVEEYNLLSSYPNPFNPETTVTYRLAEAGLTELTVFNLLGQPVTTLVNDFEQAGFHQVLWSGLDANGVPVGSGVYLLHLKTNTEKTHSKNT